MRFADEIRIFANHNCKTFSTRNSALRILYSRILRMNFIIEIIRKICGLWHNSMWTGQHVCYRFSSTVTSLISFSRELTYCLLSRERRTQASQRITPNIKIFFRIFFRIINIYFRSIFLVHNFFPLVFLTLKSNVKHRWFVFFPRWNCAHIFINFRFMCETGKLKTNNSLRVCVWHLAGQINTNAAT